MKKEESKRHYLNLNCVNCGKEATEGSMRFPYCKKCFKEIWDDDYGVYKYWVGLQSL